MSNTTLEVLRGASDPRAHEPARKSSTPLTKP